MEPISSIRAARSIIPCTCSKGRATVEGLPATASAVFPDRVRVFGAGGPPGQQGHCARPDRQCVRVYASEARMAGGCVARESEWRDRPSQTEATMNEQHTA